MRAAGGVAGVVPGGCVGGLSTLGGVPGSYGARACTAWRGLRLEREELLAFMGPGRYRRALVEGDVIHGEMATGAASGTIKEIVGAADVVRQLMQEAEVVMSRLNRIVSFR